MKHSSKVILIEIGIILASLFCLFIFKINYYVYLGILIALAVALRFFFKPEKREERFNTEILLIILISLLFYYAITYFLGFFTGFYYSNYSKSLNGILFNVVTSLIMIFSIENIRETLIKNYSYHSSIIYLTPIICCLLEIPAILSIQLYTTTYDIFNAILTLLIPCISKNIALTFITYKSNKNSSILYQLLLAIPAYFVPAFPNFGDFFDIVIKTTLPIIVLILVANIANVKFEKVTNSRRLGQNKYILIAIYTSIVFFIVSVLYLTSNMFRFTSLAIGSESMHGAINKGDVVIIDKKYKKIKKGDVIAFEEQGKVIVHRVVGVSNSYKGFIYQTKGDANNDKDNWKVTKANLMGKEVIRIRFLGWPTVALSELLQDKKDN